MLLEFAFASNMLTDFIFMHLLYSVLYLVNMVNLMLT